MNSKCYCTFTKGAKTETKTKNVQHPTTIAVCFTIKECSEFHHTLEKQPGNTGLEFLPYLASSAVYTR